MARNGLLQVTCNIKQSRPYAALRSLKNRVRRRALTLTWRLLGSLPERELRVRTRHGIMTISSRDRVIGRSLFIHQEYDIQKADAVLRFLGMTPDGPEGGTGWLIDVGANIGTVCIPLVRDGYFARAAAVEPDPFNASLLRKNVAANTLCDRIVVLENALSAANGTASLAKSADNFGDHRITFQPVAGRCTVQGVPLRTLDDIVTTLAIPPGGIRLLWIDVQGWEFQVLQGGIRTLAQKVPVVIEFWPEGLAQAGATSEAFSSFLGAHFRGFVDLADAPLRLESVGAIPKLFKRYRASDYTDLLLVN